MSIGRDQAVELVASLSALLRAGRTAAHRSEHQMGAAGTPLSLLKVLRAGDARPGDLAVALHVAPSVVSRAIVPLEARGLIARATDPEDGRATLITLTEQGRQRLTELQDGYVARVCDLLADWDDVEARQAARLLRRLERALNTGFGPTSHARHSSPPFAAADASLPHDPTDTAVDAARTASTRRTVPA